MSDASRRVLIVEDDDDISESMADLLEGEGYKVGRAADGAQALRLLRAADGNRPGLILLDLMMPRMDGYQFRAEQRADPALAGIPVLVMSAAGDMEARAAELGAGGYLKKPFRDLDAIVAAVNRLYQSDE
ncbi:MAG TPA: response regulator [Kofleriaceae bacterium]|nr:response regulator [Kofleriaceae bacterium]